jgi:hypothetical protein
MMGSSGLQLAMRRRGAWGAALLCASILCASSARAEPTPTDKAVARNLMAEGRMLRNQGNLTTALKRFQSADEIMHVPTVVLRMPATADEVKRGTAPSAVDSTWRTVGYVGLGLSSAALVTGAITGALAMASKRTAEVGCVDSRCPPPTWNDIDRARNYATVSTIAFSTSASALVEKVCWVLRWHRRGQRTEKR